MKQRYDSLWQVYKGTDNRPNKLGFYNQKIATGKETQQYFYHSDHLGSSSLITDLNGDVAQHIEYIPFGEVFVEERNNKWSTPYKFNAKEMDEETGLYYYGARYYNPRTSVWISVDPLAEKYANTGSYVFCHNNPVKYVDPDGKFAFLIPIIPIAFEAALDVAAVAGAAVSAYYSGKALSEAKASYQDKAKASTPHQRAEDKRRENRSRQESLNQAKGHQKVIDGAPDPQSNGDSDPKLNPKGIIKGILSAAGVLGVTQQVTNPDPSKDAYDAHRDKYQKDKNNQLSPPKASTNLNPDSGNSRSDSNDKSSKPVWQLYDNNKK